MSTLSAVPEDPAVGIPEPHESAVGHVTGTAMYTDDIAIRRPDALTAWPVQAPHAHARVVAVSTEAAHAVPGVVRVLTAQDVPGVNEASIFGDEPLFPAEVMYYGHPVCWVLGETPEAARLGAAAVAVEYEPLPSLITVAEAVEAGSFQGTPRVSRRGDVDAAFSAAAHVFEGHHENLGQEHFYLETHASLAYYDESGQLFIQCSTQHPGEAQEIVAHVLGLSANAITVQSLRMGGGFGGKETQPHGFAAIAALGATVTGRPVRLRLNRTQDITITGKAPGFDLVWKAGFDDDGRLVALSATMTAEDIKQPDEVAIWGGTAGVAYDPCYHAACDTIKNVNLVALDEMSDALAHALLTFAMSTSAVQGTAKGKATGQQYDPSFKGHLAIR